MEALQIVFYVLLIVLIPLAYKEYKRNKLRDSDLSSGIKSDDYYSRIGKNK
jgi:hypothetical protein